VARPSLEDVPFGAFHGKLAVYANGGLFCDGYILSSFGLALTSLQKQIALTPTLEGVVAAAPLAGIFLGGLVFGYVADLVGRRFMFLADLLVFVIASLLLGLTILQMYFGALVAGLRAGKIYNTWPLIDGTFIPSSDRLFFDQPWWRNLFENLLTVQFEHRMTAYLLFALALWHLVATMRTGGPAQIVRGAAWLAAAVTVQATLGILTLINQAPLDLALTHQAMALAVVVLAVAQCERLTPALRERNAGDAISFAQAKAQPPSA